MLKYSEIYELRNGQTVYYICFEIFPEIIEKAETIEEINDPPKVNKFLLFRMDGPRQKVVMHSSLKLLDTLRRERKNE